MVTSNQFEQSPIVGQLDLRFNTESVSAEIASTVTETLRAGQAVKVADIAGGVPKLLPCAANDEEVFGFINYDIKNSTFRASDKVQVSRDANVIYLEATTVIPRLAEVTVDIAAVGGVAAAATGNTIVGYAYDSAVAIGDLVRVVLRTPSFRRAV